MLFLKHTDLESPLLLLAKESTALPHEATALRALTAGTVDASKEKHTPVVTLRGDTVTVTVGSVNHPMASEHYIEWIAIETKRGYQLCHLSPEQAPEATFRLVEGDDLVTAYAYCNLHGLWSGR